MPRGPVLLGCVASKLSSDARVTGMLSHLWLWPIVLEANEGIWDSWATSEKPRVEWAWLPASSPVHLACEYALISCPGLDRGSIQREF